VLYCTIIFSLAIAASGMVGWNSGFDLGYDAGIADVLLKKVNPNEYFKKNIKPIKRKN
jgi:hypothetical protein